MLYIPESLFHSFFEITGTTFIAILVLNLFFSTFKLKTKISNTPAGAMLGFIPGCSGAISSSLMYSKSTITFGVLAATLISTMGDGAFILISTNPQAFLKISIISFTVATIVGLILNKMNFKIKNEKEIEIPQPTEAKYSKKHIFNVFNNHGWKLFIVIMPVISIFSIGHTIGLIQEHHIHNELFEAIVITTFLLMAFNALVINRLKTCKESCDITCKDMHGKFYILKETFDHTSTIIILLMLILIPVNLISNQINFAPLLISRTSLIGLIIMASLISLIPGSAAHILMVSLFINSKIPFVVLLASSIATSGDATWVLFRSRKKAFLIASIINFICAITIALIYWLIFI